MIRVAVINPDGTPAMPTKASRAADKGGQRKRKGETVTPFGVRCGDKVKATKAGVTVIGWVGGYTKTAKTKNIAVYDHNWKRLGQYTPSKVQLIRRSNKLCVA